jgi:acyl carrier protein
MTTAGEMTPTSHETEEALRALLAQIAPDADVAHLDPAADLRAALDIDSFDFLQFVVGIKVKLGVEIPEADYGRIRTLGGCRRYVMDRRASGPSMAP